MKSDVDAQENTQQSFSLTASLRLMNLRALAEIYRERGDTEAVRECEVEAYALLKALQAGVFS